LDGAVKPWSALISAFLTLFTLGCVIPVRNSTAEVEGKIVDARTKRPIVGATVMMFTHPDTKVKTDAKGCFFIQADTTWVLAHGATMAQEDRVEVSARGYKDWMFDLRRPDPNWSRADGHEPASYGTQVRGEDGKYTIQGVVIEMQPAPVSKGKK
jgi:hypothetical protein